MATGSSPTASTPTGSAGAALLSAGLGILALGCSQVFAEASPAFKDAMQRLGNLWIPGAAGIGPYSGKETVALLVWLLSWALLHGLMRKREANLIIIGVLTLMCIGVSTTILWPPVTHQLIR